MLQKSWFMLMIGLVVLAPTDFVLATPLDWISTAVDQQSQNVLFTLQFKEVPNFYVVDEFGRQQDSFQIWAFNDPAETNTFLANSVTRGEEIHLGGGIPIRNVSPSSPDPAGGGWGSIRGTVPFVQQGTTVSYIASLNTLGLSGNLPFTYQVLILSFGGGPDEQFGGCVSGTVCYVPLLVSVSVPDMFLPTLVGLIGIGILAQRRAWSCHRLMYTPVRTVG